MTRIKNLVSHDRISIGLLAAILCSCLVALSSAATSTPASIPERLLDCVRGANPTYYQWPDSAFPNCNAIEVSALLGQGITAMAWNACIAEGTVCIQCANLLNHDLEWYNNGNYPAVYPKPVEEASCTDEDSYSGECKLIGGNLSCYEIETLTCTYGAIVYGRE
jgi:hypothetical protein